jgi:hypothetical protein
VGSGAIWIVHVTIVPPQQSRLPGRGSGQNDAALPAYHTINGIVDDDGGGFVFELKINPFNSRKWKVEG